MSKLWRDYEWCQAKMGRAKGQIENRSSAEGSTAQFLQRGWIEEVDAAPEPEPVIEPPADPVIVDVDVDVDELDIEEMVKEVEGPPEHRALTSEDAETK